MDYLKFRLRSFTVQNPYYSFQCGSNSELPTKYSSYTTSDVDGLAYCYDICAIPWNRNPPKNTKCTTLRIDSTDTPSGYARLKIQGDAKGGKPSYYRRPRMLSNIESGGPSIQNVVKFVDGARARYKSNLGDVSIDKVFAIYCPYWPVETEEWRKRKRFHGWPNEKLIARITRGGCHFVSKLRTWSSSDDTEWRFSFSKAELLLIHSWTDFQKFVYHVIRDIKRRISENYGGDGNKGFQTYFFKTLMLWACEEYSPEFWSEQNTMSCVRTLFFRFRKCLNEQFCPNYFIPDCNIMSHLKDEGGYRTELQALMNFLTVINTVRVPVETPAFNSLGSFEYMCIKSINRSFPINENLNGRFSHYLSECEWFLPGIKNLHSAIEAHLRLLSISNIASRKESKDYVECHENFKCALIGSEDFESVRHANPELSWYEYMNAILIRKQIRDSIPVYGRRIRRSFEYDADDQILKQSLPSSLLWVVSAYRVNFHFTAMQSYKESLTECDECLDIMIKVNNVQRCYSSHIPVLICNSLSQIYDEHLQVILGFVTLHRNISSSDSSNISTAQEACFKLNAVEFLKYLRIQSGHKLRVKPVTVVYCVSSKSNFEEPYMSQLVIINVFSAAILFAALRQGRVSVEDIPRTLLPLYCSQTPDISPLQLKD